MYRIYDTEAIVLSAAPASEGSRAFLLLSKDFGLILARAEGVRKNTSKFRGSLQALSVVSVSLVRGRGMFRVVHAGSLLSYRDILGAAPGAFPLAARISLLLRRMSPESERNEELYRVAREFFYLLPKSKAEDMSLLEIAVVMRLLSALGYFPSRTEYQDLFQGEIEPALPRIAELRKSLISDINAALAESHL